MSTSPNTRPDRGTFARDIRTQQIVRVAEHGRGSDVMVRTAYKADGYWMDAEHLRPVRDPHAWSARHLVLFAVCLLLGAASAYGQYDSLTGHGIDVSTAILYVTPVGLMVTSLVGVLTGIFKS